MGHYTEPIMKLYLSFPAKYLWAIIRACIPPTFIDSVIMLERAILLASILVIYDTDWACMMTEQIHESAL